MRNMSFMLTTDQVSNRTKFVTRRLGWGFLVPGDPLRAVEKGMGLKAGEKVKSLSVIRVEDFRSEPLNAMLEDQEYGIRECILEGFGDHPMLSVPAHFVEFFCKSHRGCTPQTVVNRIAFSYVA